MGATQHQQVGHRISFTNTDYERLFDANAKNFKDIGVLNEKDVDRIKKRVFGITDESFRVQFKNPTGLILGYLMYFKIDVQGKDERVAFEEVKLILSKLYVTQRKATIGKKKEDEKKKKEEKKKVERKRKRKDGGGTQTEGEGKPTSVTDVDIIRYYTFWKTVVMRR
jgi:hypothetical protein